MRSPKVFYHKQIACLLLVLYGVPAALGPFWHTHSSPCKCLTQAESDELGAASKCSHPKCCAHVHFNHARQVPRGGSTGKCVQISQQEPRSGCDDGCLICQFYSFASLVLPAAQCPAQSPCTSHVALHSFLEVRIPASFALARGPPSFC